jgi:hypothetical protein
VPATIRGQLWLNGTTSQLAQRWARPTLEYLTALLFFAAAMLLSIAPASSGFSGFASSAFWLGQPE